MPTHTRAAVDLRLTRAALFAVVCVVLSTAGHTFASGDTVPVSAMAAGWFAVFALAALLAGRERTLPGIAGVLLGGQLVLHTLFSLGQWHRGHAPGLSQLELIAGRLLCGTGAGTDAGDTAAQSLAVSQQAAHAAHHAPQLSPGAADAAQAGGGMCAAVSSSLPMLLGHVAAALIAGWLLHRGELALWSLTQLAARAAEASASPLRTALALMRALRNGLLGTVPPVRAPVAADEPPGCRCPILEHSVARRGPPAYVLAA